LTGIFAFDSIGASQNQEKSEEEITDFSRKDQKKQGGFQKQNTDQNTNLPKKN
jgi:hypothetical protein